MTKTKTIQPLENVCGDDISLAISFSDKMREKLMYVDGQGFFVFGGKLWEPDASGVRADALVQSYIMNQESDLRMAAAMAAAADQERIDATVKALRKYRDSRARKRLLDTARPHLLVDSSQLDAMPNVLNLQNGLLDLSTFKLLPHKAEHHQIRIANATFDPTARCERWTRFIDEIMQNDQASAEYLQKIAGYSIAGNPIEDLFFILLGEKSRNGKSTFCAALQGVLGEYAKQAQPETVGIGRNKNASGANEDVARLFGARFVLMSEPEAELELSAALVKQLTGRDRITARFLYKSSFEFLPKFVLVLNINHLPRVRDMTIFKSGRVKIVPFDKFFEENERDRTLGAQFATEQARSAILNWLIMGYQLYQKEGLHGTMPEAVRRKTQDYADACDTFGQFLADCTVDAFTEQCPSAKLYDAYKQWSQENGLREMSNKRVTGELKQRGYSVGKGRTCNFVKGIKLQLNY